MANLSLTGGEEEFGWRITGLGSAFNQANGYVEAGITRYQFTQSSHSISGVVDSVRAPSSGGSTSTTRRYVSYDPGTYDFWGYTLVQDGTYWPSGSDTVTVESPAAQRPDDWSWYSTVRAGQPIELSAYEWNAFCNRINDFRVYVGLPEYGAFERAYSGDPITADIVEQAVYAIRAMDPPTSTPRAPSRGDLITADFFNDLRRSLNSID